MPEAEFQHIAAGHIGTIRSQRISNKIVQFSKIDKSFFHISLFNAGKM
jgi:hypothetical protein